MRPAELTELQSFHRESPPWVEQEVQRPASAWACQMIFFLSSYLGHILQSFLIGLFILQQITFFKICRDAARER